MNKSGRSITEMKQLDKIKYGERFFYGDVAWVKIPCCSSTGAPVIAEAPIFEWAFDIYNNNDWRNSSLRRELNGTFLNSMIDNGAAAEAFLDFGSNLTTDDGTTDYGYAEDKVAIPSAGLYRIMRGEIPRYEGIWWTLTPTTCNIENAQYVRAVMPDGTITSREANFEMAGARPVCFLRLDTLVYTEEEKKQGQRKQSVKEGAEAVMETLDEYGTALWAGIIVEVIKAIFAMKNDAKELAQEISDTREET